MKNGLVEHTNGTKYWYQNDNRLTEEEAADILLRKEIDETMHEILEAR
jgi:hypothetical protein